MIITGLDLSLTGSGVATVHTTAAGRVIAVEEYGTKPTLHDLESRSIRLRKVAAPIICACEFSDVVAIEDLFMGQGTGAQLDRAGLWWIVVNSLCASGIPVVAITNNHLKMWCLGKGGGQGTDKTHILAATIKRYPDVNITSDNVADALNLAAMAAHFYGHPTVPMPATNLRALAGVKMWPNLPNHPIERNA